ncbi:hypothetical protein ONZ43_g4166 [Nemania bipapillata]|uniref:Uncharacterized protein n=1 Tax=Nemania bipapillata TaxID=110536 RepID=A0ACC2IRC4_9PEZI|nr:hypothetical protein ONZ43_g4166 [Nemania bipapillata]
MLGAREDPIARRRRLATKYKEIELRTIPTLFDPQEDTQVPLWPPGTASAQRHWDWIAVLDGMVQILNTPSEDGNAEIVDNIAKAAPANDNELWVSMDFDIALENMAHWRKLLADVWKAAMDDPELMTVANVFVGNRSGSNVLHEWYDNEIFRFEILARAAENDENGLAGELQAIFDSIHKREGREEMQKYATSIRNQKEFFKV